MEAELLEENTLKGIIRSLYHKDEVSLSVVENQDDKNFACPAELKKNLIHFYFCTEGSAIFEFGPHYSREIQRKRNYFFYNPEKDLPFNIELSPATRMVFLTISLEHLHQLFLHDTLPFLKPENINRKFYDERDIPASLMVVLNQLSMVNLSEAAEKLYYQAKVLELLSLYFSEKKAAAENCPFLNDEEVVRKIKNAKEYLLKHSEKPPSLKELAKLTGLNEYQLKVGFKQIYGNTVYGFLLDHKLTNAQLLLDTAKFKVNEVAYQIGYTNPSHFIAAFKKKFGVTPKKYLMNR
ncbi:MAG TPA: AraC family transcriptional regulator [Cyclobacteriaceae bacterium]